MNRFTQFLIKYSLLIVIFGTFTAGAGAYFSVQLYMNLRTEIEELLPTDARSVKDLNAVSARLRSLDNIVVLVFSKDTSASKKFTLELAKKLNDVPKSTISLVEYRIDKELEFFKDRRALYIDLNDLHKIHKYIEDRIKYEKELYNPLTIFKEKELKEPQFDYAALRKKYSSKLAGYDRFPGGFYATADEQIRALIVYMPGKGLGRTQKLKAAIENAVTELNPSSYGEIEVKYTGNGQNLLEESAALVEDLELSTIIVLVLVTAAMVFFFRSVMATSALVLSLFMGTFWTFGVAYFAVGYLNANTAFLASIVIGNGINFGIILLARYLEERRTDTAHFESLRTAIKETSGSTLTAALAAALSYGSLMTTSFRGFSQFGVIGLVGMILCWISAYTLLPAYLTLIDRNINSQWYSTQAPKPIISGLIASWVEHFPKIIWGTSVLGLIGSIFVIVSYSGQIIETDLTKLRDKTSIEKGSGALYHYIDDIFGHSFSPLVILPNNRNTSRKIAALFRKQKKEDGDKSLITTIQTLDDFVPENQVEKVKVLRQIHRLLPERLLRLLPPKEQNNVTELLNPKAFVVFNEKKLPPLILSKFQEVDGSTGKIVLVDKLIEKGHDDAIAVGDFVQMGRRLTDNIAPNTPVAGDLPISFDIFQSITVDGPKATLFALLSVVLLVVILFRNLRTTALVLFSLGLGVTWLAGLIFGLNLKINFLNFIALPITFGIGVDYGVNVFQRYRQERSGSILKVIRSTGGAVMLCSLTTTIGYGSLLLAGNQAFVSFGQLAVLGEITCMLAAVVSLPAFLLLRHRRPHIETHLSQPHEV